MIKKANPKVFWRYFFNALEKNKLPTTTAKKVTELKEFVTKLYSLCKEKSDDLS